MLSDIHTTLCPQFCKLETNSPKFILHIKLDTVNIKINFVKITVKVKVNLIIRLKRNLRESAFSQKHSQITKSSSISQFSPKEKRAVKCRRNTYGRTSKKILFFYKSLVIFMLQTPADSTKILLTPLYQKIKKEKTARYRVNKVNGISGGKTLFFPRFAAASRSNFRG